VLLISTWQRLLRMLAQLKHESACIRNLPPTQRTYSGVQLKGLQDTQLAHTARHNERVEVTRRPFAISDNAARTRLDGAPATMAEHTQLLLTCLYGLLLLAAPPTLA
jgi:predicted chitinase